MNPRALSTQSLIASVLAGLAVALVTFLASSFALFVAFQAASANIGPITLYFAWPAVLLFVLVSVVAAIDGLSTRVRRVVFGFIAAIFGAYLGALVFYSIGGDPMATAFSDSQLSLVNNNLVFMAFAIVAVVTIARPVYDRMRERAIPESEEVHRVALVRAPAKTLNKGQVTHVKRRVVRVAKAETQWAAYLTALEAEGFRTLEVEPAEAHPDSVFIEDTVVMLGQSAVIASPGAESRRGETDAVAAVVAELGLTAQPIRLPGTLDGGDVLTVGTTVYVGRSGRTNAEGIRQFRAIASELGYTVIAVPVTKALHLKSSVTALPDGTIIGHPSLVDHPELFDRYLEVPEASGVAVVVLSQSSVLIAASAPKTAALITDLGYRVLTVDISEFEKLEGSVTCLSVRIR